MLNRLFPIVSRDCLDFWQPACCIVWQTSAVWGLVFLYHMTVIYGIYLQTPVGPALRTIKVSCVAGGAIVCFMWL